MKLQKIKFLLSRTLHLPFGVWKRTFIFHLLIILQFLISHVRTALDRTASRTVSVGLLGQGIWERTNGTWQRDRSDWRGRPDRSPWTWTERTWQCLKNICISENTLSSWKCFRKRKILLNVFAKMLSETGISSRWCSQNLKFSWNEILHIFAKFNTIFASRENQSSHLRFQLYWSGETLKSEWPAHLQQICHWFFSVF